MNERQAGPKSLGDTGTLQRRAVTPTSYLVYVKDCRARALSRFGQFSTSLFHTDTLTVFAIGSSICEYCRHAGRS